MKLSNTNISRLAKTTLSVAICATFLAACSESSSSDSASSVNNTLSGPSNSSEVVDAGLSNEIRDDDTNNAPTVVATETASPTTTDTAATVSELDAPVAPIAPIAPVAPLAPVVTAPPAQDPANDQGSQTQGLVTTRVDFDITVPVFVSNSLQVQITWGDQELFAGWVTDETWRASADFETDTSNPLTIQFLDGNGAIVLGSYDQSYQTGTSASEIVQISADQFDVNSFDDDLDGVSNLDESIAQTDPLTAPDPAAQELVRVDFGVNVPVIVSDSLNVTLLWGDERIEAAWVGDESWSAFADLPVDTEEPLIVSFTDDNGELVLGRYETTYETANNGAEYFQIEARQINVFQFDNDTDGVSNYLEVLAETDPNVVDSGQDITFTEIKGRLRGCSSCHTDTYKDADALYEAILGWTNRDGENFITPFEPENSFLLQKLEGSMGRFAQPGTGGIVRAWITKGALDD